MSGSLIRETPPWARMSAGTRSRAITATAPASSAILACSAVTTSMMTPPFSISAMPRLTREVPVVGVCGESDMAASYGASGRRTVRRDQGWEAARARAWRRTAQMRWATVTVAATARIHTAACEQPGQVEEVGEEGGHEEAHEPVRALRDADLGVVAQVVGLGPGVGRHRAHHQDDQAQRGVEAVLRDPGEVERRRRRRARRRRPGRGWSRGTPRSRPCGRSCGPSRRRSGR